MLGRIPTRDEYLKVMATCVSPFEKSIYRYLDFSQLSARVPDFAVAAPPA
jgi:aconitase B